MEGISFSKKLVLMWAAHVLTAWAHEWGHLGYACAAMSATGSLPQGGHKGSSLSIKDSKKTVKDPKKTIKDSKKGSGPVKTQKKP